MLKLMARVIAACVVAGLTLSVAGCAMFFPSRPEANGPISLGIVDNQFAYVMCFPNDIRVSYMHLGIDVREDEHFEGVTLLTGENSDGATVTLRGDEVLVSSSPPEGLEIVRQERSSVSEVEQAHVKAFISLSGPDLLVEMAFDDVDVDALRHGQYQYQSGKVSVDPCGMTE